MSDQPLNFIEADVPRMASLACLGYVGDVGDPKLSASGVYVIQPISVIAYQAGRNVTFRLMYRPEWLVPGFDPASFKESAKAAVDEDEKKVFRGMEFVFRNHIAGKSSVSALKGLSGSEEAYVTLSNLLLTASNPDNMEDIREVLRGFFLGENDGAEVGYILNQARDKTEEVTEQGKAVYSLRNTYEVGSWFLPTDAEIARLKKRAERVNDRNPLRVTFEV
jgi:hypothetical protein